MEKIQVTKSYLPPIERFFDIVKSVWENNWLTNNGPLLQSLESKYANILGVDKALCVSNGTIALQLGLRALGLKCCKIITTPYTYVATSSAILWEECEPVFVDVREDDCNIDPEQIERAIDSQTKAILAVHVYGTPCDVFGIDSIAKRHGLKVIYDSAHAFGVSFMNRPISEFGDLSTFSLHATKLVHTGEGGLIVSKNPDVLRQLQLMRAFGHIGDEHYALGINTKMTEIQAALGLAVLEDLPMLLDNRKKIHDIYTEGLAKLPIRYPVCRAETERNYSYFPIFLESNALRELLFRKLAEENIMTRRYFWPSLNTISYMPKQSCPVSESLSQRVLCLPMYADLTSQQAERVVDTIYRIWGTL